MNLLSIKRSITPIFQGAEIRSPVTEGMFAEWKLMHNELRSRPKGGLPSTCTPETLTFCVPIRFAPCMCLLCSAKWPRAADSFYVRFQGGDWWWWRLLFHLYFLPADVEFTPTCFMFSLPLYSFDLSRWRVDKKTTTTTKTSCGAVERFPVCTMNIWTPEPFCQLAGYSRLVRAATHVLLLVFS